MGDLYAGGSTFTAEGVARHAYAVGARGSALRVATAIALAESGGDYRAHAVGVNVPKPRAEWGHVTRSPSPDEDSYGLWQINFNAGHRAPGSTATGDDAAQLLFHPGNNAAAMWAISKQGRDWSPWSAYNNGRYLAHLPAAQIATDAVERDPSIPAPSMSAGIVSGGGGGGVNVGGWPGSGIVEDGINAAVGSGPVQATAGGIVGAVGKIDDLGSAVVTFVKAILSPSLWLRILQIVGGGVVTLWAISRLLGVGLPVVGK